MGGPPAQAFLSTLTAQERSWLREHPVIRVASDPQWPPIEFTEDSGRPAGISSSYVGLIQERLGLKFEYVPIRDWATAYRQLKSWDIDMTPSVTVTEERSAFWAFTRPYQRIPIVIATHSNVPFVDGMPDLDGKRVAVGEGYAISEWLRRDHPGLDLVKVRGPKEGLDALAQGKIFAYIDNILVIGYYQARGNITNVKISGQTSYVNEQRMAVRKDWAILAGILDKALASITADERATIYRKWIPFQPPSLWRQHKRAVILATTVAGVLALMVLMLFCLNRRLQRARNEALRSTTRYRSILRASPDSVAITDMRCQIRLISPATLDLFVGYREDDLVGWPFTQLLVPGDRARASSNFARRAQGDPLGPMEYQGLRADGSIVYLEVNSEFIRDANGQATEAIIVSRDITERKLAELGILNLTEELERRVKDRTAKLEAANQEMESFSYAVSHDLRAPLRSIDGFSQILLEDYQEQLDENGKHHLARIRNGIRRMELLITDLLRMSRLDRVELKPAVVDLSGLCHKIVEDLTAAYPERQVEVSVQPGMEVWADHNLLQVVLENLLGNAWKYTSKRKVARVEVGATAFSQGERALFIRDNGVGFDMAHVSELFIAFHRLHLPADFEGTGVGLATVKRIIDRHAGRIWAEAEPGKGAAFFFTLPRQDRARAESQQGQDAPTTLGSFER